MDLKNKLNFHFHQKILFSSLIYIWATVGLFFLYHYANEKVNLIDRYNYVSRFACTNISECIQSKNDDFPLFLKVLKDLEQGSIIIIKSKELIYSTPNISPSIIKSISMKRDTNNNGEILTNNDTKYYFYSYKKKDLKINILFPLKHKFYPFVSKQEYTLVIMLLLAILLSIISYVFTKRMGRNLYKLRKFSQHATKGDLIVPEHFTHDELGEISNEIINLYSNLKKTSEERDKEHDIAAHEMKERIRIKHELTNNINHELKTPVASISGYIETLMENPDIDPELRQSFLNKCYAQTQRFTTLLKDVTTISKLDETGADIKSIKIDLTSILTDVSSYIDSHHKSLIMRVNINFTGPTIIYGDPSLIYSIFQNLANNAYDYSGGTDIFIRIIAEDQDFYTFSFEDNGSGLDPKHFPRIFERFYRIDKGRSRKLGGSGLGLSIVKNAVLMHKGKIAVSNGSYGGLRFVFNLPKRPLEQEQEQEKEKEKN